MSDKSLNPPPPSTNAATNPGKSDGRQEPESAKVLATVQSELENFGLPRQKAAEASKLIVTRMETFHSGPLPTVRDFEGYERICPGAARDILEMAKCGQKHYQAVEKAEVYGDLLLKILGNFTALAIVAAMLLSALYAAMNGHNALAGIIASGTGLSMVAGVFIRNHMNRKQNQEPLELPKKPKKR